MNALVPHAPPIRSTALAPVGIFADAGRFEHAQRVARVFSESALVPAHFRGKLSDCLIALNIADRMQEDPLTVMQNLAIVNGRPCWQTQYMIARANKSGVFTGRITWRTEGQAESLAVTASAVLAEIGEAVSVAVTLAMAKADGWTKNPKYTSMPEHMLRWRSAAMLVRLYAPEVMLGIPTAEEVEAPGEGAMRDVTPRAPAAPALTGPAPSGPPRRRAPEALAAPTPAQEASAHAQADTDPAGALAQFEAAAQTVRTIAELDEAHAVIAEMDLPRDAQGRAQEIYDAADGRLGREVAPDETEDRREVDASDEAGIDPDDEDYQRGVTAARQGKTKCLNPDIRNDERRMAAWAAGFSSVDRAS